MDKAKNQSLHLPDISVRNFRGIRSLKIRRLGRVSLIAGRNGVGKTTLLEAVHVFASRGSGEALSDLLGKRNEFITVIDEDDRPRRQPNYEALFHGRVATPGHPILIGPETNGDVLRIQLANQEDLSDEQSAILGEIGADESTKILRVYYDGGESWNVLMPYFSDPFGRWPDRRVARLWKRSGNGSSGASIQQLNLESLGPGLPTNSTLARYWDRVALTDAVKSAIECLGIIDEGIEGVAAVGDPGTHYSARGRRILVRRKANPTPVPLASLGDGITRLFAAALALACSHGGILIIDEVENGIHHSIQQEFWGMILDAANKFNVQVLATTHSFDCVRGFAGAAVARDESDSVLVRLERVEDKLKAVEYSLEDLKAATTQGIEIR